MRIAIHNRKNSFSDRWISYCQNNGIQYKLVDAYSTDIITQISDCDAFMWHHGHMHPKDIIFAQKLLFALEHTGIVVFPDFKTAWHFDDKVAQKYLLEAINAPTVPTWVFYSSLEALEWIKKTDFPKVFKLRGGAGSSNVKLVNTEKEAKRIVNKAFGAGFSQYNALDGFVERWRKYKLGKTNFLDVLKGIIRFVYPTTFTKYAGKERGYAYFQQYIPNNKYDIRVIVVDNKAFAIKRLVRENDFRASGSGSILYDKDHFDENTIRLAFKLSEKLNGQSIAFDFVYENNYPLVVEVSYGFMKEGYDKCEGYWDKDIVWHEGKFDFCGWMVDRVVNEVLAKIKENGNSR